jgi:hypothetical protein
MLNNPNPLVTMAEWCRYCIHLTNLKLNHLFVVEAMGSKAVTPTSSAMVSPPYKISFKSINWFKKLLGKHRQTDTHTHTHTHTHGQTGDLICLRLFLESRLKCVNVCVCGHGNAVNAINKDIWTYQIAKSQYISIYLNSRYISIFVDIFIPIYLDRFVLTSPPIHIDMQRYKYINMLRLIYRYVPIEIYRYKSTDQYLYVSFEVYLSRYTETYRYIKIQTYMHRSRYRAISI